MAPLSHIYGTPLGPSIWKYSSIPPDNGVSDGVQPGDWIVTTTGLLYAMDNNHQRLLLNSGAPGADYYVSPTGDNTKSGTDPDNARKSIQNVHDNLVVTGNGDRINLVGFTNTSDFVENVTISKRDVSLVAAIPVGNARLATIIPATGVALTLAASAWGFSAHGIRFVGAGTNGYGAKITADGALFVKCDFVSGSSHAVLLVGDPTGADADNTGSGFQAVGCMFRESGGDGIRQGDSTGGIYATNVNIYGCQFYGNTGSDIKDSGGGSQALWYQWDVSGNRFMDRNKTNYLTMNSGIASQTLISHNWFNDAGLNNVKIKLLAAGIGWVENYDSAGHVAQSAVS